VEEQQVSVSRQLQSRRYKMTGSELAQVIPSGAEDPTAIFINFLPVSTRSVTQGLQFALLLLAWILTNS
jgi:hypothetical protein